MWKVKGVLWMEGARCHELSGARCNLFGEHSGRIKFTQKDSKDGKANFKKKRLTICPEMKAAGVIQFPCNGVFFWYCADVFNSQTSRMNGQITSYKIHELNMVITSLLSHILSLCSLYGKNAKMPGGYS